MNEDIEIENLKRSKTTKRKINKFFSDYFNWLVFMIVIIILFLGFFFVIKPRYEKIMSVVSVFDQQEFFDLDARKQELERINNLIASYEEIDDKYKEKIDSMSPIRKNKEEIFSEINHIVSTNGLLMDSISLSSGNGNMFFSATYPNLEMVTVKFGVRGVDYESFKNFLSAMESNLPLLDVLSLSFSPSGRTADFSINTYYIKE